MHRAFTTRDILQIADAASQRVLNIYSTDFKVTFKADESPITVADLESHQVIVDGLRELTPNIPILSEEGENIAWEKRKDWQSFWLIDPIDGTKEFTQRTDEFTVNIALIEDGVPVLGVVTAPALKEAYWGAKGEGAYKRDQAGEVRQIAVAELKDVVRVVASKNHLNDDTKAFIQKFESHELIQAGSSLKFCRIAEGQADIYPRLGPTCEWDTGAAHAVLNAAGGKVETLEGKPLVYGKEDVLNSFFVASGAWYR